MALSLLKYRNQTHSAPTDKLPVGRPVSVYALAKKQRKRRLEVRGISAARRKDPTRTVVLRTRFMQDAGARLIRLKGAIRKKVVDDNYFGWGSPSQKNKPRLGSPLVSGAKGFPSSHTITKWTPEKSIKLVKGLPVYRETAYTYTYDKAKIDGFMDWLQVQHDKGILEMIVDPSGLSRGPLPWSNTYVQSAYQKGIATGRQDLIKAGAEIPSFESAPGGLAGVMNQPFHVDRLGMIYSRTFTSLKDITAGMDSQISRELALGLADGIGPREIARRMNKKVDIGIMRAKRIARTEVVHAHNEAQLNEYESAEQVLGETVLVQWTTAGDQRVRPTHAFRDGVIFNRKEARGLLGEPNCRCGLLPYVESIHGKGGKKELPKKAVEKPTAKKKKEPFKSSTHYSDKEIQKSILELDKIPPTSKWGGSPNLEDGNRYYKSIFDPAYKNPGNQAEYIRELKEATERIQKELPDQWKFALESRSHKGIKLIDDAAVDRDEILSKIKDIDSASPVRVVKFKGKNIILDGRATAEASRLMESTAGRSWANMQVEFLNMDSILRKLDSRPLEGGFKWSPSKDLKDAEKQLKQRFKIKQAIVKGLKADDQVKVLNHMGEQLSGMIEAKPQIGSYIKKRKALNKITLFEDDLLKNPSSDRAFAGVYTPSENAIKMARASRFAKEADDAAEFTIGRWHTVSIIDRSPAGNLYRTSANSSFRHEFGHFVHDRPALQRKWTKMIKEEFFDSVDNSASFAKMELGRKVSQYGVTKSKWSVNRLMANLDDHETFAESFSAWSHPKYKKGVLPRAIEKFLEDNIK